MADKGADADWLRVNLPNAGTVLVIPGERTRKPPIRFDNARFKDRWRAEAASCRLKGFRRFATHSDKLARDLASAVAAGRCGAD